MFDFLAQSHAMLFNPDRIPTILAAWLVAVVIGVISGPLANNVHPFSWQVFSILFGRFGDRLDKTKRPRADLMFRGFLVTAFALLFALAIGKLYDGYAPRALYFGAFPILALALLMTAGSVWFSLLRLYFALEHNKVQPATFRAIEQSSRLNLSNADNYGVTRAAIGVSAYSFDKGLVAPAIWYIIGGFPLTLLYVCVAALSWRFGKYGFHSGFGGLPIALERLMGYVPSLFAALLLNIAAFITPTAKLGKSLASWLGHKGRAAYEQGGYPLSALAWSLNITLGGAAQGIAGSAIKGEWVGPSGATAKIDHHHLRRAIYINVIAHILFVAALLGAYIWSGILS